MKMFRSLKKVMSVITAPVRKEFFFFAFFLVLISATLLTNLFRSIIGGDFIEDLPALAKGLSWSVFVSYVFTCLVCIPGFKWLKYVFYALLTALFALNLFLRFTFGLTLSPLIVLMIGETNPSESSEFAHTFLLTGKAFAVYAITALLIVILLFENKIRALCSRLFSGRRIRAIGTALLAILLVGGAIQIGKVVDLLRCDSIDSLEKWSHDNDPTHIDYITGGLYALKGPFAASNENKRAIAASEAIIGKQHTATDSIPLTIVYVLGESYIKHHSNLYGYPHITTPVFTAEQARGNLLVFNDVVSPSNATTDVAKNTFSCNSLADGERWYEKPFFPVVFRQAGFEVSMYDNQMDYEMNANFTFSLNSFLYNKRVEELAYTYVCPETCQYDEQMTDRLLADWRDDGKNKLAILHLLGQHIETKERYPLTKENIVFTRDSIHRTEPWMTDYKRFLIASYDNATHYNDRVVGKLFDRLRQTNAVVVYFADHGDEVYDYRDSQARLDGEDYANLLHYQFEVPFLIWCSDTYRKLHPTIMDDLLAATNRPFMIDNVAHVLFHLAGINTPCYIADRDLTSPSFKARKRVVESPERKYDYDETMKKK